MKTHLTIADLIARKVVGATLTPQEEETLEQWLHDDSHRRVFHEIKSRSLANRFARLEQEEYGKKMAARFFREQQRIRRQTILHRSAYWLGGIAAALLLLLGTSILLPLLDEKKQPARMAVTQKAIIPGEAKATLTLADGREFGITENNGTAVGALIDSVAVAEAQEQDEEKTESSRARVPIYNTLSVPRGGEFFHQLADGTKVWLNSDSELRFPDTFADGKRHVYLEGEAFFEVTKDTAPFIVTTRRGDIRVYGTTFCATDYEHQPFSTVLVAGSIGFRPEGGEEVSLKPSQRLEYNAETGRTKVETVDTALYTAWKDHYFLFRSQTLEEIMNTLSRWYNFHVVFTNDRLRTIRLSGRLYRYDDVQVLLDSYAKITGIQFQVRDNNIIITN